MERAPRPRAAQRAAEPARPAPPPEDDFGFGTDDAPPRPDAGALPEPTGAPGDDGEMRRRRRRRGGRGRRRRDGPPDAGAPVLPGDATEAAAPPRREPHTAEPAQPEPVSADEFGAMLDEEEARGAAAAAAASAAPPSPAAERDDRPPRRERGGRSSRRGGRDTDADAPRPQQREQREQRTAPAAPFARTPHGVEEWFSPARLDACQRAVHYHFRDVSLLENALTHSSIKSHDRPSYERMEFLGDSVIGLVIAEYIYNLLPDCDEGELTKVKSLVVSTDGLADAAKDCGLDKFLAVGRGILMKDAVPRSLIADVFEGVVGAVYLDRGYETVRLYVLDLLGPRIKEAISDRGARNFKSVLQQVAQRDFGETPFYEVLRESGPEHARVFEVVAVVGRRRFGVARAATKKEAEQAAAKLALQTILMEKSSRKPPPRRRRSR
jgi:ribonuclease-3